jgi:hypothetical protein
MVPAASASEAELLATPFGQLLMELSASPKMLLSLTGKLLELALVLANSVTSDTVRVVLFAVRIATRVESSAALLLRAHSQGIPGSPLLAANLQLKENVLAELRSGCLYIRRLFNEALQWVDKWLDELKDIIRKDAAGEDDLQDTFSVEKGKELEEKRKRLDENMTMACNLHAHVILMLRNLDLRADGSEAITRLLASFSFLSMHHTFNTDRGLDIPEPELFEIYHRHRSEVVGWFEERMN